MALALWNLLVCFLGYNIINPVKPSLSHISSPIPIPLIPLSPIPFTRLLVNLIITAGTKKHEVHSSPSTVNRSSESQTDRQIESTRVDKPKLMSISKRRATIHKTINMLYTKISTIGIIEFPQNMGLFILKSFV